jgi:hypothetical protein
LMVPTHSAANCRANASGSKAPDKFDEAPLTLDRCTAKKSEEPFVL